MHYLLAFRAIAIDMLSTILFVAVWTVTGNLLLAVGLAMALGVGQILYQLIRRREIGALQWLALVLVMASGAATLVTQDARFVMIKPTVIYAVIGVVMLKPGWMDRYLPQEAHDNVPRGAIVATGFAWAGLMFLTGAANLAVALTCTEATWRMFIAIFPVVSKIVAVIVTVAALRRIGRATRAARDAAAAAQPV